METSSSLISPPSALFPAPVTIESHRAPAPSGATPGGVEGILDRRLNRDDVTDIVRRLVYVQRRAKTLGRLLKLPQHVVGSIPKLTSDPQEPLFYIMERFVREVKPKPTWRLILAALKDNLMKECALAEEIEESLVPKTVSDSEANCSQRKAAVMTPAVPQVASANAITVGAHSSSIAEGVEFSRRKFGTVGSEQLFTMPRSQVVTSQEIDESLVLKTVSDSEGSSSQCKAAVMIPLTPKVSQVASDNAVTTMKASPQYQSISQRRLATGHLMQPFTLPRSGPQAPGTGMHNIIYKPIWPQHYSTYNATAHLPKRRQVLKSAAKHQYLKASRKARGRPFFDRSLSSPAVSSVPTCK